MVYSRSVLKAVIAVGAASSALAIPLPSTSATPEGAPAASATGLTQATAVGSDAVPPVTGIPPTPQTAAGSTLPPAQALGGPSSQARALNAREFNIIFEEDEKPHKVGPIYVPISFSPVFLNNNIRLTASPPR